MMAASADTLTVTFWEIVRQRHDKLNLDSSPTETCEITAVALSCKFLGQYIMSQ